MIKKSIYTFIIVLCFYNIFLLLNPGIGDGQHQWQNNRIKAQEYIYSNNNSFESVIIGTSLSYRLRMDSLPGYYNLSFGGQSVFDGLRIIKNSHNLPSNLFIETNFLLRNEDRDFINSLFSTIPYYLNKNIIACRSENQPVSILLGYMKRMYKSNKSELDNDKFLNREALNDDTFDKILQRQIQRNSNTPDSSLLNRQLDLLLEYIKYFETHDVNIFLFEMPVHTELVNLPGMKTVRNELKRVLPKEKYNYIDRDSSRYKTRDGLHLDKNEALRYTLFLKQQIKRQRIRSH